MSRLAAMKKAVEELGCGREDEPEEDFWGYLANMGGEDRFRFSITRLERNTGLHRESIVDAKRRLAMLGIVNWISGDDGCDLLYPNPAFRISVTSLPEGRCSLAFSEGAESGQEGIGNWSS